MKVRIFSGIIIFFVFIGATLLPLAGMKLFFLLLALLATYELIRAFRVKEPQVSLALGLGAVGLAFVLLECGFNPTLIFMGLFLGLLFFLLFFKSLNLRSFGLQIFTFFYMAGLFLPIVSIENKTYIWLIYLLCWLTDTFAYFVGITLGKHRLCERLSPKKSIEGAIGGTVLCTIFALLFFRYFQLPLDWRHGLLIVLATVAAQAGDLTASFLKRQLEIKDYGHLIPGHGGIMDRIDSMIFVVPIVYIMIQLG